MIWNYCVDFFVILLYFILFSNELLMLEFISYDFLSYIILFILYRLVKQKSDFIVFLILFFFQEEKSVGKYFVDTLCPYNIIRHYIKLKFEHMNINIAILTL